MSASKKLDQIAWAVTAFILSLTILFMNGGAVGLQEMARSMGYETRLFDNTRVHTVDIVMDDWDELIANATNEEYYAASVVIDGEAYQNVGIRAKGNTSLSTVASMDSERYSFKIEFDHYDSSKSYHGLDKLCLNNLIQDSTMMKDYLTYTLMNEFGVDSPLCSYVYITVNGEDWGLYLAVEGVEDSFLERNYGSDHGELYKPDSSSIGGGRGNGKEFNGNPFEEGENAASSSKQANTKTDTTEGSDSTKVPDGSAPPEMPSGNQGVGMNPFEKGESAASSSNQSNTKTDTTEGSDSTKAPDGFAPPEMNGRGKGGGFGGGAGMGSADVKLQYIDDELDSYSNIWNNAKTKVSEADQKRLVESLKKLSNAEELESVVDVEEVIRYFVVHNYVCNGDSYTGTMVHNYYLYEEDGRMSMIPWDYNLAFGTFQGGNAQSTVNTPIDSPVSGGSGEDRPMWNWILSDESYTEQYHQYFAEFLDTVDIQSIIDNAYQLIAPYVEQDPTAFYTKEEFEQGVQTLKEFCSLRSESISIQLEEGETTEEMDYVDASGIALSDMGSMNNGMGREGGGQNRMPGNLPSRQEQTQGSGADESTGESSGFEASGEPNSGQSNQTRREFPFQNPGQLPEGAADESASDSFGWLWIAGSALLLGAGLLAAKLYR